MDSERGPREGQQRLAAFAEELRAALETSASIETDTVGAYSSVSVEPRCTNALGIGWLASDDEVVLSAGGSRWELEPTEKGLDLLEGIVLSVIAGRVSEAKGRRWSRVEVTLSDGTVETTKVYDGISGLLPGGRRQVEVLHYAAYH